METTQTSLAEVLSQVHDALLGDLRKLEEAACSESREGPAALGTRLKMAGMLLTDHFRFEEKGGYMASVQTREPRLERVIRQLLDEHRQLIGILDALIQEIGTRRNSDESFGEKIRAWIEQVRRHESRENLLLVETFNYEVGAGD